MNSWVRHPARAFHLLLASTLAAAVAAAGCRRGKPEIKLEKASVVLVTLDTTRADYLGVYGQQRVKTPNLDALGNEGVVFTHAFTSVPLTVPAHASLLTGTTPLGHGLRDNFGAHLPANVKTLAEALEAGGWRTEAVVGAAVLDGGSGLERGFASYDDLRSPAAGSRSARTERDGRDVVERALLALDRLRGAPFFLWVHLYDPHLPYEAPSSYASLYPNDPYGGEVAYVDALVGKLMERLRGDDRPLVVVAADHGEGLGEHGEPDHGVFLYDSTLRVPLIFWAPGALPPALVDNVVRDIDVMPTVLDLLGHAIPGSVSGRSLRLLLEGRADAERVVYAESDYARLHYGWSALRALRDGSFKYVDAPQPELFDIREDPGETRNVLAAQERAATGMRERLRRMQETSSGPVAVAPRAAPEVVERLRSLGYAGTTLQLGAGANLPDPKQRRDALPALSQATSGAMSLLEDGRTNEALELLDRAIAAEPRFLDGHVLRGEALYRLERFAEATTAFERALALNPGSAEGHYDLARSMAADGQLDAALKELDRAREIFPRDRRLALAEAQVHRARHRPDQALSALRLYLSGGDDARVRMELGRLLVAQGMRSQGESEIQAALAQDPTLASSEDQRRSEAPSGGPRQK